MFWPKPLDPVLLTHVKWNPYVLWDAFKDTVNTVRTKFTFATFGLLGGRFFARYGACKALHQDHFV